MSMKNYSALIVITTCKRIEIIKQTIWEYIKFVNSDANFNFVLSLDGEETEYLNFAEKYEIPLIYSKEREGVGLSKNRVLKQFPNYDYYFFIEDDVYLLDASIFNLYIRASQAERIPHMMVYGCTNIERVEKNEHYTLVYSTIGGAAFNFFSKKGLEKVGGWNTLFSKYKRFGHTEHSYRFFHQSLQKSPFISIKEAENMILVFDPPHVTKIYSETNERGLCQEEQGLINNKTNYFPLQTISPYYFNNKTTSYNQKAADFIAANSQIYPLTKGRARRKALAEHYALLIPKTKGLFQKISLFLKSIWYCPTNVALKHYVKTQLFEKS
jgi:hypothetical protein